MSAEAVYDAGFLVDNDAVTDRYEHVPTWLYKPGGLTVDEFFRLDLPPHTELIDGGLVFLSPAGSFHFLVSKILIQGLERTMPSSLRVRGDMGVLLGEQKVLCPDVFLVREEAVTGLEQTRFQPEDLPLAVEVVSPSSHTRDRLLKPLMYAEAGIPHFWRVENEDGQPVVHVHELDPIAKVYRLTGVHRDRLKVEVPFDIDIDLTGLDRM